LAGDAAKVRVFENRMEFIMSNVHLVGMTRVLDIGSCFGWNSFWLAERGCTVVGVERGRQKVDVCECLKVLRRLPMDNPIFHCMTIEDYAFKHKEEKFDLMLNLNTFHHMIKKDERRAWRALDRLSQRCRVMVLQCRGGDIHEQVIERTAYESKKPLGRPPGTRGVISRGMFLYW